MNPIFKPSEYTTTPARLSETDVHAVIVRCDFRPEITTTNVKGGSGLHMYFGVVEEGARGILLEKTFFFSGTQNDNAAKNVLADVCRLVGHTDDLLEEGIQEWCEKIATTSGPVKIVTQPDPKSDGKYRRPKYINQATGYTDAREVYAEQIDGMRDLAKASSARLSLASGTSTDDVAL